MLKTPLVQRNQPQNDALSQPRDASRQYGAQTNFPVQRKSANNTGINDSLKQDLETSFNTKLDHLQFETESSFPAQVGAVATAQKYRVDIAPGHYKPDSNAGRKLIGHEVWHTIQQAQGRVKPTMQMKSGHNVNDNKQLEAEADRMGELFARGGQVEAQQSNVKSDGSSVLQGKFVFYDKKRKETKDLSSLIANKVVELFLKGPAFATLSQKYGPNVVKVQLVRAFPGCKHLTDVQPDGDEYDITLSEADLGNKVVELGIFMGQRMAEVASGDEVAVVEEDADDAKQENPNTKRLNEMIGFLEEVRDGRARLPVEWGGAVESFYEHLCEQRYRHKQGFAVDLIHLQTEMQQLLGSGMDEPEAKSHARSKPVATAYPIPEGVKCSAFANPSIAGAKAHLGKKIQNKYTIGKSDLATLLGELTYDDLLAESMRTEVLRHDFQNYKQKSKAQYHNYQIQIGGSQLVYKGKANTSLTNVICDPNLFMQPSLTQPVLLALVVAMHKDSFDKDQTVIIVVDDDEADSFIKARQPVQKKGKQ